MTTDLRVPAFPPILMNTTWDVGNRVGRKKIQVAALSIRSTLSAMCGMHVHTTPTATSFQQHAICLEKYKKLLVAMENKYPEASVVPFLKYTSLTKNKEFAGLSIYRMSQQVRTTIAKEYNTLWTSSLGPDKIPPSGRTFEWVRKRVLIMLWRKGKKDNRPMSANADVDAEYDNIMDVNPFWGQGEPRSWHAFMTFGLGMQVLDADATACIWTLTSARSRSRKRAAASV